MDLLKNGGGLLIIPVIIVLQVILPATVDILLSATLAGTAGWVGWRIGRASA